MRVCAQMLVDSDLRPQTPDAPLPAPVSLFRQPAEANVRKATQLPPQGLRRGLIWRGTVETQRIYEVRPSGDVLAFRFCFVQRILYGCPNHLVGSQHGFVW